MKSIHTFMYHKLVFYICFDKNCNTYKCLNFFRNMFNNSKAIKIYCCIICNILHMPHPFFQVNHIFNKHSQIWVHFDIIVFQISQWIKVALKSHASLTSLCQCLLLFALNLLPFYFFFLYGFSLQLLYLTYFLINYHLMYLRTY